MLPLNEIGHAREEGLVGDVDENNLRDLLRVGFEARGSLNWTALGAADMNENWSPGEVRLPRVSTQRDYIRPLPRSTSR